MLCVKTMCKQYKLATPPMSKVVFVCNVPYNMSETRSSMFSSRLVRSSVLSILSAPKMQHIPRAPPIRLVYDRDTGKPKGYGFCEFAADSDPFLEEGELVDGGVPGPTEPRTQWRTGSVNENRDILASVSAGTPLEPGVSAQEAITQTLASGMSESQLIEVLAQMKAFVITRPEQARQVLQAHPQLGYAIFMGLITSKIIPAEVLQRMLEASGVLPPLPAPPPHLQQHPPPPPRNFPPPQLQQNQPYPPPPNRLQHPQPVPGMMPPPPMAVPPPSAMFGHQVHMAPPPPGMMQPRC
ncbi:hinge domain of cleavage stimulation factor subunit 2-domain-containing protein [Mycena rebaudengoi]|nr:hinge domain of cleavage stimulation factor subunit 2-domain-containing protein [Mycena rebaudengoi]